MSLEKPTIVIFDMDGTTVRHLSPFILGLCERFDDITYKTSKFFEWIFRRKAQGPVVPLIEEQERKNRKKPRLPVHRTIHKMRRKSVEQIVEPCPGIYDVLELLKANNIPLAMVSNGLGKGYGHDILQKFELDHFFSVKLFREDIKHSKPHPEPILLALRDLGAKLKDDDIIWYIGDRHKDVTAALAAKSHIPCKIQPIAYGMNAAAAIVEKGVGHEHIILDYKNMAETLAKFFPLKKSKKNAIGSPSEQKAEPESKLAES